MWTILAFFAGLLIGLAWMYCIDLADIAERDQRILELEAINEQLTGEGDEVYRGWKLGQSYKSVFEEEEGMPVYSLH